MLLKTRIKKFMVCEECYCLSISNIDCVCAQGVYRTIELEFEVCECCGGIMTDGEPAETEFNKEQINELNK